MDEVAQEFARLAKDGNEDDVAMFVGKRTMRALKIQKVSDVRSAGDLLG